ncbi:MAG TPA: protein tyrosine phosphatase [Gammaproteobacteria bacterium]|nr:protein tyrosine phosphatase [Gammaproteobacteria bacterium]
MQPEIYWIKDFKVGHLAIMPRPRAGDWLEDEIKALNEEGLDILVSLLMPDEVYELDLKEENTLCGANGIELISFPIKDRQVPALSQAQKLSQSLLTEITNGKKVAIHCRMGIGRSALMVASILVCSGIAPVTAYQMVTKSRGLAVPDTQEQKRWLDRFAQVLAQSQ